jgi:histidinol-phosphate aminotransferase
MSVSRRGFLQGLGTGRTSHAAAFIAARGHEEQVAEAMQQQGRQGGGMRRPALPPGVEAIRISSNENPLGPGKAAIDAILGKFPEANRYPFNSSPLDADLEILLAKLNTAKRENVVLGVGSQELLKNSARVFMSPTKHLVIPSPTYGDPAGFAQNVLKYTVKSAPVDGKTLKTDLAALLPHVKGAGLVYICNPNNPTATINSTAEIKDFIAEVKKTSPTTAILIDEAYCDYAGEGFQTAIPIALATPGVLVARTFSKAYGMAGVRIGYAIGDAATVKKMAAYKMPYNVNTFGVAAAIASLKDPQHIKEEAARNKAVRDFTVRALADLGYTSTDSHTNFIFTDIGKTMTAAAFRDGCAAKGIMVGRDFPPLEKTWARISLGTMDEMQKATDVFRSVLKPSTTTSSGKGQ